MLCGVQVLKPRLRQSARGLRLSMIDAIVHLVLECLRRARRYTTHPAHAALGEHQGRLTRSQQAKGGFLGEPWWKVGGESQLARRREGAWENRLPGRHPKPRSTWGVLSEGNVARRSWGGSSNERGRPVSAGKDPRGLIVQDKGLSVQHLLSLPVRWDL